MCITDKHTPNWLFGVAFDMPFDMPFDMTFKMTFGITVDITVDMTQSCKKCWILGSGSGGKNENGETFLRKIERKKMMGGKIDARKK